MKSCYLKCRKDTEAINPRVLGTSNGKVMILPKRATRGSKKSRFISPICFLQPHPRTSFYPLNSTKVGITSQKF